ncbi:hypothetical protein D3C87_1684960 [compost metagenome]
MAKLACPLALNLCSVSLRAILKYQKLMGVCNFHNFWHWGKLSVQMNRQYYASTRSNMGQDAFSSKVKSLRIRFNENRRELILYNG